MAETSEQADSGESLPPDSPDDAASGPESSRADLLACLRRCTGPCEPPVGIGSFDVLYASGREVVVWYSPARPEHRAGEVAIPTARLMAAWNALRAGEALDDAALERIGDGAAVGRWLLALLAQLPGVRVRLEPALALEWSPPPPEAALAAPAGALAETEAALTTPGTPRRRRKRVE